MTTPHDYDNVTPENPRDERRSREEVLDTIRRTMLGSGIRPIAAERHAAEALRREGGSGFDPYNSGPATPRNPWARGRRGG